MRKRDKFWLCGLLKIFITNPKSLSRGTLFCVKGRANSFGKDTVVFANNCVKSRINKSPIFEIGSESFGFRQSFYQQVL